MAEELWIQVDDADGDEEHLDSLTRQLLGELREAGVEGARLGTQGPAPEGSKALELIAIGSVLVHVLPAALPALIGFLQEWSLRGRGRTVKLKVMRGADTVDVEYPVDSISKDQVASLVKQLVSTLDTNRRGPPSTEQR
jgi:hypothetical protein